MPPENLVQPEAVRRLAWTPPPSITAETVADALRASGARAWQVQRVAGPLAEVLPEPAPVDGEQPPAAPRRTRTRRSAVPPAPAPPPFSG